MEAAVERALSELFSQWGTTPAQHTELLRLIDHYVQVASRPTTPRPEERKPVRVYVDGCFDIMHSGHYNALRQARALGDILVAGVHSDAEILLHKGPTTMNEEERVKTVKACKWVDEVVFDVPYSPSIKLLDDLNVDFCVHGDDMPTNADGTSTYDEVKKAGRIRIIKRTEGVSTTDLVGRMLLMTRDHHLPKRDKEDTFDPAGTPGLVAKPPARTFAEKTALAEAGSNFLPTTKRLLQFANIAGSGINEAKKVIYIDGAFDLFHIGHIETLEKARSLGDFLLVGVHSDFTVNLHKGKNYPIMNLHERVLNVLACKYADEVIMGAPWVVTKDMITTMNIKLVVCGSNTKLGPGSEYSGEDPYGVPKALGIFQEIQISRDLTTETIVDRILANRARFEKRNQVREKKEKDYLQTKNFVPEI